MSGINAERGEGALADAMTGIFQVAYVTADIESGREAARRLLGAQNFINVDATFDVVDYDGKKLDDLRLKLSFAFDRRLEIIEPVYDSFNVFAVAPPEADEPMVFHHTAARVTDLKPALDECRERELSVVRLQTPESATGMPQLDVAFIDLRALANHSLELLSPRSS